MKKALLLATMLVMAFCTISHAAPADGRFISKTLYKDAHGGYHYVQSEEAKSIMNPEDLYADDVWIVPCHVVMNMTEEEFEEFCRQGNGGDQETAE